MAQLGSILLISCYELGHQPLGLASPLAFLERAGYSAEVLDIAVDTFDQVKVARAGFVGISVPMHTALRLGVRVAERVRALNPACHICFYGMYAALNAAYLLGHGADSAIGGEYEEPLVALIEAVQSGRAEPVDGVSQAGRIATPHLQRLPFPAPSRGSLAPLERYAHFESDGVRRRTGYVEASRGCLHMCRHCPIPPVYGGRFFIVPRQIVLEDIGRLVEAGATHITFGDPDFLNGPGHALRIAEAMHQVYPGLSFDFTAKVEHILEHRHLLPRLRELGCAFVVSAFESLSETVLAHLDKGHSREDMRAALGILRDAGIAPRPTWVAFTPWTTLDDYLEMLAFIEDEGLIDHVDPVQYGIRLLLPPGSSLLHLPGIDAFLGPLDEAAFSYRWRHPDPRMDALQRDASTLVEAEKDTQDAQVAFYGVRRLALIAAGQAQDRAMSMLAPGRARPPRLTEPWFC